MIRSVSRITAMYATASSPDLTPMLDVIFMLLVFFMLTANSVQHVITVDLPKQDNEQTTASDQQKRILVTLYPESGRWDVNGKEFHHWEVVKQAITTVHQMQPEARFMIAGDRNVTIERLLQLLSYLRNQGIAVADVLMQPDAHHSLTGKQS